MHVSRGSRALTTKKCIKMRDARAEVLILYYLQNFFAKSGWKVNGTRWVVPAEKFQEQRNISKVSPVFLDGTSLTEILEANYQISVSGFRGRFSVDGTDLYKQ